MLETNKIVATRIKELREISDFTVDEVVAKLSVDADQYLKYENAEADIPISILYKLASVYKVEFAELITGDRPHLKTYCLVRDGKGVHVERHNDYHYQSLAANFSHKKMEPFMVTITPLPEKEELHYNHHFGQEFNYVLEGRLQLFIDDKEIILEKGDSIFFDSSVKHTFRAMDNQSVKLLVVLS